MEVELDSDHDEEAQAQARKIDEYDRSFCGDDQLHGETSTSEATGDYRGERSDPDLCLHPDKLIDLLLQTDLKICDSAKLCSLLQFLGKYLSQKIFVDIKGMRSSKTRTSSNLANLNCEQYLLERPEILVEFLRSLTGKTSSRSNLNPKISASICLIIEDIYALRHQSFVGPFSFANGIVQWTLSGSKAAHNINQWLNLRSGFYSYVEAVLPR